MPTQEYIKEILHYDSETGVFTWKDRNNRYTKRLNGKQAGCLRNDGYLTIGIKNKLILAHRLVFLYMEGNLPENFVDHIDGVRTNNKWSNLRHATKSENEQNIFNHRANNKLGIIGVCLNKKYGTYIAQIWINKKHIHIGNFETPQKAHEAYLQAKRQFHPYGQL